MMRSILVFCTALALGALTVSGQENEKDDLRRRIRELTEQLKNRADRRAPEDLVGRPTLRVYEVGDLAHPIVHAEPWQDTTLLPSKFRPPEGAELPEPTAAFPVDYVIELMRRVVEPATWDTIEGADIMPRESRLFVRNVPRAHRKIPALLEALRDAADRQLEVEIVAVEPTGEDVSLILNRPRELTAEEEKRLLSRDPLARATLVCRSGQMVRQRVGREVSYLQDYDVEIAQEATIGDPIRQSAVEGLSVWLHGFLDDAARGARLDVQIDLAALTRPIRKIDTEHGALELPVLAMSRLSTSAWVPLDTTVVLGGAVSGDKPCLFLARVSRAGAR